MRAISSLVLAPDAVQISRLDGGDGLPSPSEEVGFVVIAADH